MSMRLFLVLFFSSVMSLFAQGQVRFEVVNTPDVVAVGEVFRIEFNTNTTKPDKFIPPKFNGMTVMAGPSQSQSTSIINGKRSDSYSYIYVVSIDSVGKYTIPSAEIEVDGKKYKTKEFKIEAIVESGSNQRSGQQSQSNAQSQSQRTSSNTIATDDVLLRLVPSKTNVYRGEPIIVSIKLYTRVSLSDIRNFNLPAFNGFWTQRIDNTGGSHANLTDDYAAIRNEMKQVASYFNRDVLRECDEAGFYSNLPAIRSKYGDRAVLRATHFFEENKRVDAQSEALSEGDFERFLSLIAESGDSSALYLQNAYSVSAPSSQGVTLGVNLARKILNKTGAARLHGGGFAGIVQAFVPTDRREEFIKQMTAVFGKNAVMELQVRPQGPVCILPCEK